MPVAFSDGKPVPTFPENAPESALDDADIDRSEAGEAELARAGGRQVDDAAANEGTAVVDADHDRTAVFLVGDAHLGAERQRLVGGRQRGRLGTLAIGSPASFISVDRSNS